MYGRHCRGRDPNQVPVAECMTKQVITCQASDELEQVADLMAEKQVRRIPVVDRRGAIVGIVALADIARSRTTGAEVADTLHDISEPASETNLGFVSEEEAND